MFGSFADVFGSFADVFGSFAEGAAVGALPITYIGLFFCRDIHFAEVASTGACHVFGALLWGYTALLWRCTPLSWMCKHS